MLGRWVGSGVGKYNAKSPRQGSKRFNSITKTIHFARLFYYSSMTHTDGEEPQAACSTPPKHEATKLYTYTNKK